MEHVLAVIHHVLYVKMDLQAIVSAVYVKKDIIILDMIAIV